MGVLIYWAAVFFVIALALGVLGFSGISVGVAGIAKILCFAFLILGSVALIMSHGGRLPT